MRVTSLRNGSGGDIFFRGLAKTFQAAPVIPKSIHYLSDARTVFISDGKKEAPGHESPRGDLDSSREKIPQSVREGQPADDAINELKEFHK